MAHIQLTIRRIDSRRDDIRAAMAELRRRSSAREGNVVSEAGRQRTIEVFGEPLSPQQVVERICRDVRAARAWPPCSTTPPGSTRPSSRPTTIRVPAEELAAGPRRGRSASCSKPFAAWRGTSASFQQAILHRDVRVERPGGYLVQRYRPLDRVGICVPGGAAAYPSTVLMTAVPAQVAGVQQLAVVAPPTKFGAYNADLLATCHELGITEVYRLGGAQAVAALAYGVEGIPRVDKIVGPGNLFVALAKKHVFGEVDIDSIAGPSEVVVIVDESTRPEFTAIDLIAQAEHAPGASVLIGWDERVLDAAVAELARQLARVGAGRAGPAEPGRVRRGDSGPRRRRGLRAGRRDRPGAPAHRHGERRAAGREDSPRRGDVPGQLHAGGPGRLRGRPVARAAHQRHGPIRQRTVGQRLPADQQHPALRPGRPDATGPRRASAGHQGRPDRPSGERGSENEIEKETEPRMNTDRHG